MHLGLSSLEQSGTSVMWLLSILGNPYQFYELGVLCVDFNLNINNELNQRQTPYVVHEEDQVTKSMVANMTMHFLQMTIATNRFQKKKQLQQLHANKSHRIVLNALLPQ